MSSYAEPDPPVRGGDVEIDLFAGLAVSDLQPAINWFDRFFGEAESFDPNDTERVWTVSKHRHAYVVLQPEHAGHAVVTLFVDDFDGFLDAVAQRGIRPETRERYETGYGRPYFATRTATRSVSEALRSRPRSRRPDRADRHS
jgi:hypothetical protein